MRIQNSSTGSIPDLERATLHGAATVGERVIAFQDDFAGRDQVVERVDGFCVLSLYDIVMVKAGIKKRVLSTNLFGEFLKVVNETFKIRLCGGSRVGFCP
jgi:hypothetical protein